VSKRFVDAYPIITTESSKESTGERIDWLWIDVVEIRTVAFAWIVSVSWSPIVRIAIGNSQIILANTVFSSPSLLKRSRELAAGESFGIRQVLKLEEVQYVRVQVLYQTFHKSLLLSLDVVETVACQ